jgi:fructose-bisphosphate aldolase class II
MLTNLKEVLRRAEEAEYAVPQFNINNLEILKAVIEAAIKMRSPVILATTEGAIKYAGMDYLKAMVEVAVQSPIPVVFHLDHGRDLGIIKQAIEKGYTSIMFDGSHLSFEENVNLTWRIVQWAHTKGISVEAELGTIAGKEDNLSLKNYQAYFTNPQQAEEFVRRTQCDALAVAIGTAHGAFKYASKPKLDLNRLKEINNLVQVPLVLHGASGIPRWLKRRALKAGLKISQAKGISDKLIKQTIKLGVRKINIDTDLRLAFTTALREVLQNHQDIFDPRQILTPAKDLMFKLACEKIKLFKSAHQA